MPQSFAVAVHNRSRAGGCVDRQTWNGGGGASAGRRRRGQDFEGRRQRGGRGGRHRAGGGSGQSLLMRNRRRRVHADLHREDPQDLCFGFSRKGPRGGDAVDSIMRDGKPDEDLLRSGPLAVAVPGEVAGLAAALKRFGKMDFPRSRNPRSNWRAMGSPAESIWRGRSRGPLPRWPRTPASRPCSCIPTALRARTGETITRPTWPRPCKRSASIRWRTFITARSPAKISGFVKSSGGLLSADDLAAYRAVWREPVHGDYRDYQIYSMPPPSAGGGMLLEALELLEPGKSSALGLNSPPYLARLIETMRQIFIDRATYYGDPDFVHVPIGFLLSPRAHRGDPPQGFWNGASAPRKPRATTAPRICAWSTARATSSRSPPPSTRPSAPDDGSGNRHHPEQ